MNNKTILLLVLTSIYFSCKNKEAKNHQIANPSEINDLKFTKFAFDTTENDYKNATSMSKWSDIDVFFGVYRFSDNCVGIGIELFEGGNYDLTDELFRKSVKEEEINKVIDSSGAFILRKSPKLLKNFTANDTTRQFYIFCTRGVTKAHLTDVYYNREACSALLVLKLSEIDTAKYGQPVMASKKNIALSFSNLPDFQNDLNVYCQIQNQKADYTDAMTSVQFAFNEDYFLCYDDNFLWHKDKQATECLFPARSVFVIEKNRVKRIWANALDLYGIGCD